MISAVGNGVQFKITSAWVISTFARGTERCLKCSTFCSATGSLATTRDLLGIVPVAAGDVAGLVGVGEGKVKEYRR